MPAEFTPDLEQAIGRIPSGLFVLTATADGRRSGVLARWVQLCSFDPPMVVVALPKGQLVEPLIRDSRSFALCQIGATDRFLQRKFSEAPMGGEDPFVTVSTRSTPRGAPIIDRAMSFIDCEVVRHVELESDYRLYVGQVHGGEVLNESEPAILFGDNGSTPTREAEAG